LTVGGRFGFDLMYGGNEEHAEVGQLASLKADQKLSAEKLRTKVMEVVPINTGMVSVMPLAA